MVTDSSQAQIFVFFLVRHIGTFKLAIKLYVQSFKSASHTTCEMSALIFDDKYVFRQAKKIYLIALGVR